jgi:hypothetical protein
MYFFVEYSYGYNAAGTRTHASSPSPKPLRSSAAFILDGRHIFKDVVKGYDDGQT